MGKKSAALCIMAAGLAFSSGTTVNAGPTIKPALTFLEAQHCHVNGTVDYGCFQQKLVRFELFVLQDDASWFQKSIVADGLVKTYTALHLSSSAADAVRAKARIYSLANQALDKSELGEIDDCKDEFSPDGCLRTRYCFKEGYIKIKNVLVTNEPERFEAEIKWFDKAIKNNC